jgi:hypothetical protein
MRDQHNKTLKQSADVQLSAVHAHLEVHAVVSWFGAAA